MFETPTIDIQELRSVLTDAGHTAVGFATMAAKKANDVRLDLNDRYAEQTKDLRSNMLTVVEKLEDVRAAVGARVDPVVESITDRLPAPARKVVENFTDSAKEAQAKAHKLVVDALTVESVKPAAKVAASAPVAKTATKTVAKVAKPVAKKAVAKKTVAKVAKPAVAKTVAKKPAARKTAA